MRGYGFVTNAIVSIDAAGSSRMAQTTPSGMSGSMHRAPGGRRSEVGVAAAALILATWLKPQTSNFQHPTSNLPQDLLRDVGLAVRHPDLARLRHRRVAGERRHDAVRHALGV